MRNRSSGLALAVVVTCAALVAVATGCARPNPRISKMTRTQNGNSATTRFDYDDKAHPSEITAEVGGGTDSTKLTFDGAEITKLTVDHNRDFGASSTDTTDVTYKDGRLTKMVTDVGNATTTNTVTLEYDDKGNLTTVTTTSNTDENNHSTTVMTLTYGDKGLTRQKFDVDLTLIGFNSKSTTVNEIELGDDGRPKQFTSDPDQGDTTTIDITYDDAKGNRLDKLEATGGNVTTSRYDYDDQGRITTATIEQKSQKDTTVDISYDDDDVADIDMTPTSINLVQLFDLRGDAYTSIDPRTQAIRLAGLTW